MAGLSRFTGTRCALYNAGAKRHHELVLAGEMERCLASHKALIQPANALRVIALIQPANAAGAASAAHSGGLAGKTAASVRQAGRKKPARSTGR